MKKKIYVDGSVFLPFHIYRGLLSPPVRKICQIPNVPLIGENIISFRSKRFKSPYSKKYTFTEYILVNIFGTTERTYKICVVKTTTKMLDWCNIWPFIVISMD